MNTNVPHTQGINAFKEGLPSDGNPYTRHHTAKDSRQAWYDGWYDARRITRWGPNDDEVCPPELQEHQCQQPSKPQA